MCGSEVMFGAHPYGWMKVGNLLASLASLSPEYLALACSVCPRGLLSPCFVNSIHLKQTLSSVHVQLKEKCNDITLWCTSSMASALQPSTPLSG